MHGQKTLFPVLLNHKITILVNMRTTILTKNNFIFIILRTLHLVRAGFPNWEKRVLTLKFLRTKDIENKRGH